MQTLSEKLSSAIAGLEYRSETDAPLQLVELPVGCDLQRELRKMAGAAESDPVEIQEAGYFFRNQVKTYPGADASETARSAAFQRLLELLQQLDSLKAHRIGSIQIEAFVLGKATDGSYIGVRTRLVET